MNNLPTAKNRRVLVIDDNRAIHDDFRKILSPAPTADTASALDAADAALFGPPATVTATRTQFEVDSAYQGQEGVLLVERALAANQPYAVAFVDVRMPPGWDGVETAMKIWEIDHDVQIVICTAYSDYSWDKMFEKIGNSDGLVILKKPFDAVEAFQLAHTLTEKWHLHRQAMQKVEELESLVAGRTRELRWKTAFLEALSNSSIDGVLVVDQEGKKSFHNQRFVDLLKIPSHIAGEKSDELRIQWVTDMAKNPERFIDKIFHLYTHPEEISCDEVELKDGRTLDRYSAPVIGQDGTNYGRIWTFRDITERKEAEARLRLQSSALEAAANAIVITDRKGVIQWVNTAFTTFSGYSVAEALGRSPGFLKSGKHDKAFYQNLWKTIGAGNVWHGEVVNRRKGGGLYTEEMSITPIKDSHGTVTHFIAVKKDITARKIAEETLRESEEKFRQLANSINDVFWMISPDMQKTFYVSRAYEQIWGRPTESAYANPNQWYEAILPEKREEVAQVFSRLVTDQPSVSVEFPISRPDGTVRWILCRGFQVRDAEGNLIRLTGTSSDITERKMFEVQLRQAQKLESIGQLAAGIAHEINTPMQFIGDNTQFVRDTFGELHDLFAAGAKLLEAARNEAVTPGVIAEVEAATKKADLDYLMEEVPKAISQSIEGIERVTKIVRAMKDFSHPGTGSKTMLDLNHAIESTLTVCRNEWKYVAEMVAEFDPNLPPVPVFPGEFNQVILNLVLNATHAIADVVGDGSRGKGRITLSTRHEGEWIEIRIRDTGTGIPENVRDRIFDPFFTTKGVGKGTGQGLAIAHSVVVDKHGGTISFETESGKGTCFIIRLPSTVAASDGLPQEVA